jgi:hypothetical protein
MTLLVIFHMAVDMGTDLVVDMGTDLDMDMDMEGLDIIHITALFHLLLYHIIYHQLQ